MKHLTKQNGIYIVETEISDAYWISNKGKILPVKNRHINMIIKDPKSYGYTDKEIDDIYNKHKEPKGLEGKAREEIMTNLLKKGFIRLRYNKRNSAWIVQLNKLSNKEKDYLQQWASDLMKTTYKHSDVIIMTSNKRIQHSLSDIANDVLYNESEAGEGKYILETVSQFNTDDQEIHESQEKYESVYNERMIFEASLSRVWKHQKNGFFMMSSFRGHYSQKENLKRHENLKKDLRSHNLGFFEVEGVYKYDDGHTEKELSVFVPFNKKAYTIEQFVEYIKILLKKYDQESILFKKPDGEAVLIYKDKEVKIGDKVGFDKVSDAYSKIRKGKHQGRTFTIEGVRVPENHVSAMSLIQQGIIF